MHKEIGYYYKYSPEFTITRELLPQNGYEYYHCTQTDPIPGWYNIDIRYHQTIIYTDEGVSLDGGRYFTVCPSYDILDVKNPAVKLSHYIEHEDRFILFNFFNEKSLSKNDRLAQKKLLEIVPIFESPEEKKEFWEYGKKHFWTIRKDYTEEMLPPFSCVSSREQNVDALKEDYLDAMACMNMLTEFRKNRDSMVSTTASFIDNHSMSVVG